MTICRSKRTSQGAPAKKHTGQTPHRPKSTLVRAHWSKLCRRCPQWGAAGEAALGRHDGNIKHTGQSTLVKVLARSGGRLARRRWAAAFGSSAPPSWPAPPPPPKVWPNAGQTLVKRWSNAGQTLARASAASVRPRPGRDWTLYPPAPAPGLHLVYTWFTPGFTPDSTSAGPGPSAAATGSRPLLPFFFSVYA